MWQANDGFDMLGELVRVGRGWKGGELGRVG